MTRKKIGIIAEGESDFDSIKILIRRISNEDKLSTERFLGRGCGNIQRKCHSWARTLKTKGCSILFVVQDLDSCNLEELKRRINDAIEPCPIQKNLIVIPIRELEAWLLSDPSAIKESLHLKKIPTVPRDTEKIPSPKEYLGKAIYDASGREKIYINAKHNKLISEIISIECIRKKCPSFVPFHDFIKLNIG